MAATLNPPIKIKQGEDTEILITCYQDDEMTQAFNLSSFLGVKMQIRKNANPKSALLYEPVSSIANGSAGQIRAVFASADSQDFMWRRGYIDCFVKNAANKWICLFQGFINLEGAATALP